ncbi:MAG: hypothetical protein HY370_03305 [Proteobacteria bacterium]|nr:hypothetical protein [Pseudomonadota bacterium]
MSDIKGRQEEPKYRDRTEAERLHARASALTYAVRDGRATEESLEEAIELMTIAVMLWSEDYRMYCDLAELYRMTDDRAKAVPYYRAALALKPDLNWERQQIIDELLALNQTHDALQHAHKGVEMHPDDFLLRAYLGYCYDRMKMYGHAYLHINKALEMMNKKDNEDARAITYRKTLLYMMERLQTIVTEEQVRKAAQTDPAYKKNFPSNDLS